MICGSDFTLPSAADSLHVLMLLPPKLLLHWAQLVQVTESKRGNIQDNAGHVCTDGLID